MRGRSNEAGGKRVGERGREGGWRQWGGGEGVVRKGGV